MTLVSSKRIVFGKNCPVRSCHILVTFQNAYLHTHCVHDSNLIPPAHSQHLKSRWKLMKIWEILFLTTQIFFLPNFTKTSEINWKHSQDTRNSFFYNDFWRLQLLFSHVYGNIAKCDTSCDFKNHWTQVWQKFRNFTVHIFSKLVSIKQILNASNRTRFISNAHGTPPKAKSRIIAPWVVDMVKYVELGRKSALIELKLSEISSTAGLTLMKKAWSGLLPLFLTF